MVLSADRIDGYPIETQTSGKMLCEDVKTKHPAHGGSLVGRRGTTTRIIRIHGPCTCELLQLRCVHDSIIVRLVEVHVTQVHCDIRIIKRSVECD